MSEPCEFWPGCLSPVDGGCADCPATLREISSDDPLYEFYDGDDDDYEMLPCPTCRGDGTVNPLTAPAGYVCFVTTECPTCDGTGEAP